jgi:hypothetical protein
MPDDILLAADHHAIAAFQAPDSAARSHVHVVDPLAEFLGAPDVVDVVGIAAVDEDVSRSRCRQRSAMVCVHRGRRHHQPQRPGLFELPQDPAERSSRRLLLHQIVTAFGDLSNTTH